MTDPPAVTDIANLLVAATALVVALISGFYTWRAFALQRQSSSAAGMDFLQRVYPERVEIVTNDPQKSMFEDRRTYHLGIVPRGPGVRYQATGVAWGEADFEILTPTVQVWGADHPGIEFKVRGSGPPFKNIYCGVVWESPMLLRQGFRVHGYRIRLDTPDQEEKSGMIQEWSDTWQRWRKFRRRRFLRVPVKENDPVEGCTQVATSLSNLMDERDRERMGEG